MDGMDQWFLSLVVVDSREVRSSLVVRRVVVTRVVSVVRQGWEIRKGPLAFRSRDGGGSSGYSLRGG